ncbi:hypothetical protein MKW98_017822 [Papaver atlanticum]|uniref:Uncharacterized protein n=1 Tax=Papaver atlanticum TaxID=357466 RepID=A0AAD4TBY8_9MAGN|nr:hypothetical protein MKW98_017822 [Papaver atlanticum]
MASEYLCANLTSWKKSRVSSLCCWGDDGRIQGWRWSTIINRFSRSCPRLVAVVGVYQSGIFLPLSAFRGLKLALLVFDDNQCLKLGSGALIYQRVYEQVLEQMPRVIFIVGCLYGSGFQRS